jgi:hypothetical protein
MDRCTGALGALLGLLLAGASPIARADVVVSITGNVAVAEIALPSAAQPTYTATLRLAFEAPKNLTVANLGITAAVVDPLDPTLRAPAGRGAGDPRPVSGAGHRRAAAGRRTARQFLRSG